MKAPERIETARLLLRKPQLSDAGAILGRYSGDAEVTRLLDWPRHKDEADVAKFLRFSDWAWNAWPAGPYLIEAKGQPSLLGHIGLAFETPFRASTGYLLARDAWGQGYAAEALEALVGLAPSMGIRRVHAQCHPDHQASKRVLEKCGFTLECVLRSYTEFPNLHPGDIADVLSFARVFPANTSV
jgi:RimJ/RimL family protein N-acetyltransferase